MGNILGAIVGVTISVGLYIFYDRWSARNRIERAQESAAWRPANTPSSKPTARFFMVLLVGGAGLFGGIRLFQKYQERRHPAVDEHRDELLSAAAKALGCANDSVAVQAEEPTRAHVEGCGRALTFRWGTVLVQARPRVVSPAHWHQIDPKCRVDYLGCALPCE